MSSPISNSEASSKGGRWWAYLALALFGGAVLEVLFRTVIFPEWRSVSQSRFERHPVYGTFQKPNLSVRRFNPPNYNVTNTTNSKGFRDSEQGFEDDLAGVWMAGASNSFGGFLEDDEIMSARLQDLGYKIANLSSEGHKLHQQMRVVRHLAAEGYRPRAVIFEMTLNNIVGDYDYAIKELSEPLVINRDEKQTDIRATQVLEQSVRQLGGVTDVSLFGLKKRLINNSAVYTWAKVGVNGVPFLRDLTLKWGMRADVALANSLSDSVYRKETGNPEYVYFGKTADYMAVIRDWVADHLGVPFGIVIVPSGHHLNSDWFERYMTHLGLDANEHDPTRPYDKLLQALLARNILVLDTAP
ncbi:MAG: hypothetical protein HOC60_08510, partial [Rhodospirillaceae bacterium]|nr:hypothetical protein [Rhodospirillaceae bacterium]